MMLMSTYEEFMVILAVAGLIVSILNRNERGYIEPNMCLQTNNLLSKRREEHEGSLIQASFISFVHDIIFLHSE